MRIVCLLALVACFSGSRVDPPPLAPVISPPECAPSYEGRDTVFEDSVFTREKLQLAAVVTDSIVSSGCKLYRWVMVRRE